MSLLKNMPFMDGLDLKHHVKETKLPSDSLLIYKESKQMDYLTIRIISVKVMKMVQKKNRSQLLMLG